MLKEVVTLSDIGDWSDIIEILTRPSTLKEILKNMCGKNEEVAIASA